jgi:hypothetical protein
MHGSLFFCTFAASHPSFKHIGNQVPRISIPIRTNFTNQPQVQPTDFPDNSIQLAQGLADADPQALQMIFTELRPNTIRAVQLVGGSPADGNVFFQTALMDAAHMARNGNLPGHLPLQEAISTLAQLHFTQWASKHQDPPPLPIEEPEWAPTAAVLSETRKHIFVWKTLNKIEGNCRSALWVQPLDTTNQCTELLLQHLQTRKDSGADTPADTTEVLPEYAIAALERKADHKVWETMRHYEDNLAKGLNIDGSAPKQKDNTILKSALLMMVFMTIGMAVYQYINRTKPAEEVFEGNFAPPESLMDDLNRRLEHDSSDMVRPEICSQLFSEADAHYQKKNYSAAYDLLLQMINDDALAGCHSDGLFGLAIISLKREEPGDALQYLAKIDNIEAYGEDLYWYQALAFVQRAKQFKAATPAAVGAVNRFLENTRNEARRKQAEEMLENLQK